MPPENSPSLAVHEQGSGVCRPIAHAGIVHNRLIRTMKRTSSNNGGKSISATSGLKCAGGHRMVLAATCQAARRGEVGREEAGFPPVLLEPGFE